MDHKICRVEVRRDHLSKVAHASPEKALAELIWNALDAEATEIDIRFEKNALGTTEQIVVQDNGHGFPLAHAEALFGSLGGSWKISRPRTDSGRYMHGQQGQGRFKPLSLGNRVEWLVQQDVPFRLAMQADLLEQFELTVCDQPLRDSAGVTVVISDIPQEQKLFDAEYAVHKLLPIFALYLRNYPAVQVCVDGKRLQPDALVVKHQRFDLPAVEYNGQSFEVALELVEWQAGVGKAAWYCNAQGFPLEWFARDIQVPGKLDYSAYLKSELVSLLNQEGVLALGELSDPLREVTDMAAQKIQQYVAKRMKQLAKQQIVHWQQQGVYPYAEAATSTADKATRKRFDQLALSLAEELKGLTSGDKKSRAWQLAMLRYVMEQQPQELLSILQQSLELSDSKLKQLEKLL